MALSGAGFETHRAHRVAVSVSDKPLQYLSEKLSRNFDKFTKNNTKSPIETAILIRNNFSKIKQMPPYSRKYKTGTYKENRLNETGKYSANKENNLPAFQWSHRLNSKSIIQTKPQLCDKKLIYTTPEGTIGALNYKTGEVIWTKLYENYSPFARRGLTCEYNISIDTNVLYVPTSKGVLCLSPENGNTIESICNRGFIKSHKSFISPIIDKNNIYIATLQPAGVEARNINSGKLLWRTEFEVGSSYGGGGSNPWSGFTFDKKTGLIFVNTGSPAHWASYLNIDSKFKYSNSTIALDSRSGNIAWQFQESSQDYWDLDMVSKPIISPVKVNNKEVIITFSKSGSIYFLDKNTGKPVFKITEKKIKIGDLLYFIKESITPENLLSTSILNSQCSDCNQNTKIKGYLPPLLKKIRKFDGYSGGVQWPGGVIDSNKELLIVPSNRNIVVEHYYDFVPKPEKHISSKTIFNSCFVCHSKMGSVAFGKNIIYPSLFLTSRIHSLDSFNKYMKSDVFHKNIKISTAELNSIFDTLLNYDDAILSEKSHAEWDNMIIHNPLDIKLSSSAPFGLVTAISLKTGKVVWQISAGTLENDNGDKLFGSPNYAGVDASINEPMSVFTGSYDKLVYGINNINGNILWELPLPASGSAPPYIYETNKERWIFVIASGGRIPGDKSDELIAFLQKKSINQTNKNTAN